MNLFINGNETSFSEEITISKLLLQLDKDPQYLAIAVNKKFLSKDNYSKYVLKNGDQIEIVTPHPGG